MEGILAIGPLPPPIDGQSVAFELLTRGLPSRGLRVQVIDIARPGGKFERSQVARVLDYIGALRRLAQGLAQNPGASVYLTVAQSRAGFVRDCAFILLARLARRRVVIHVHGGNYDGFYRAQPVFLRWIIRRTLRWTTKIIVLSERLRGMLDFAPELASRVQVVANGLPGEVPEFVEKTPPASGEPWRLLFLSNLIESKGYLEAIEATALLRERGVRAELALCGEFRTNPSDDVRVRSTSQARELTESLIRRRGLEGCVQLRGAVSGSAKERALAEAHIFVLPTRYDAEGQPISIIEAMAWGLPVVAHDHRGVQDLIRDGVTGFVLGSSEPAVIADAIYRVIADAGALGRMARAARDRFDVHFTAAAHLRAMREVLAGRS